MLITAFGLLFCLELLVYTNELWRFRRVLCMFLVGLNSVALLALFVQTSQICITIMMTSIMIFRGINLFRIIKNRTHETHLRHVCLQSSIWLFAGLVVTYAYGVTINYLAVSVSYLWMAVQLILSIAIFISVCISIYKLKKKLPIYNYAQRDLPTVTVCVPARNETEQLESCISNLLASDYPKLEIIVLDDCSTDSTPDIIKRFAHAGVRFIRGSDARDDWLPKNQAYQRLYEEASGEYILYCGVDTGIMPQTITKLVSMAVTNRLEMVSLLPVRLRSNVFASLIQPLRYWWELAVPRWLTKSPPVLSTCWLIKRSVVKRHGTFEAVRRSVLPERYFAKASAYRYAFIGSSSGIDVQTTKSLSEARDTAVRVRYPQVHKRPELVLLIIIMECIVFIGPYLMLVLSLATTTYDLMFWAALATIAINTITHVLVSFITNPAAVPVAMLNFPVVIATELVLGVESMLRYEFGSVGWKERNICIPVMHVTTRLPKI